MTQRANIPLTEADLGGNPIHSAAARGHAEVVVALSQGGADLDRRSFSGYAPTYR